MSKCRECVTVESSYLKEEHKEDSYPPSPESAFQVKKSRQKSNNGMAEETMKITLSGIEVNKKYWQQFKKLAYIKEQNKNAFLSMIINSGLRAFLYDAPELRLSFAELE